MAFAKAAAQTIRDMAGADYQADEDSFKDDEYDFAPMMHAVIPFYGTVQGQYILSLQEKTAAKLIGIYEENMSAGEFEENREEYGGFICEVLNSAVGQAIQVLKETFEEPTILPPHIIYGKIVYPNVPTGSAELGGDAGPIFSAFF